MFIAQDILYCSRGGLLKTPKHVLLPMAVHHLTRSAQLVLMLNRFGHGISLSQIQEIDTALAKEALATADNVPLPGHFEKNVSVLFAADNNDFLEETRTGANTSHVTNSIVIQRTVLSVPLCPSAQQKLRTKHCRSIENAFEPQLVQHNSSCRVGPPLFSISLPSLLPHKSDHSKEFTASLTCRHDFAWMLLRLTPETCATLSSSAAQCIPGWTGFNSILNASMVPPQSKIGYLPVINHPPTELSTVRTVLHNAMSIAAQTGQEDIIVVFDQAIYAKAQEILWQEARHRVREHNILRGIVVSRGGFHITCTLLSVLGKRFGDAGLWDLLVESEVVSSGSVDGVLAGKHYKRALYAHKAVLEALFRSLWGQFEEWVRSTADTYVNLSPLLLALSKARSRLSADSVRDLLNTETFQELLSLYQQFLSLLASCYGPMAQFWLSYMDIVLLILRFIRATKEGNWSLHMRCVREMIPWFFCYDHTNYSRYMSVYLCEMQCLPESHPAAFEQLVRGEFAVQQSCTSFSQVPVDQALEQSVNRDTKTSGGLICMTLWPGAVQRWMLTAHLRAKFKSICKDMAGVLNNESTVRETGTSAITASEESVSKLSALIGEWRTPFSHSSALVALSSGYEAPLEVQLDLINAFQRGVHAMEDFFAQRLLSTATGFHEPIKKMKMTTFSDIVKVKRTSASNSGVAIARADSALFSRLALVAQTRRLNMRDVLSYELGALPWSLAKSVGQPVKTNKSQLLALLVKVTPSVTNVPISTAVVFDFMAVLQAVSPGGTTFASLANQLLRSVMVGIRVGGRIDLVIDQYPETSIKCFERDRRAASGTVHVIISRRDQKVPNWRKFLSGSKNKVQLIDFLVGEWKLACYAPLLKSKSMFLCHGNECTVFWSADGLSVSSHVVAALRCQHEEADTRMFFHAHHAASNGAGTVIIKSSDTDVAMISCAVVNSIPGRVLLHGRTKHRSQYLDLKKISDQLGEDISASLPGVHSFSGCDSTSAFSGKGKAFAYKLILEGHCDAMKMLGQEFTVTDELHSLCEKFLCRLYGKPKLTSINEVRYELFKFQLQSSPSLPPTQDALRHHVQRSNFQAAVWRRALQPQGQPSAHGHGGIIDGNAITIRWMSLPPAPSALMELIRCCCKTLCTSQRCKCLKNNLRCSDLCKCTNCNNEAAYELEESDSGEAADEC